MNRINVAFGNGKYLPNGLPFVFSIEADILEVLPWLVEHAGQEFHTHAAFEERGWRMHWVDYGKDHGYNALYFTHDVDLIHFKMRWVG